MAAKPASQAALAESKNLSTTLWALAALGHKPRSKLLKAIADRALIVADEVALGEREEEVAARVEARLQERPRLVGQAVVDRDLIAAMIGPDPATHHGREDQTLRYVPTFFMKYDHLGSIRFLYGPIVFIIFEIAVWCSV